MRLRRKPTQEERQRRGQDAGEAFKEGSAVALALAFLDDKVMHTFRAAKSPQEAWYARCMDRVVQDFRGVLRAYVADGEAAAAQIHAAQVEESATLMMDPEVVKYLQEAVEARKRYDVENPSISADDPV